MKFMRFAVIDIVVSILAIFLAFRTSPRLAWRLLLLVPLAAEIAMFLYPQQQPSGSHLSFASLIGLDFWISFLGVYAYAVLFFGVWPVLIGELGWLAIRASALPRKYSREKLLVA